ncbi:MAG: methylated-DNA--[protein]-cysteine S-methyltransferase [Solirubrobacterales bacterium]
MTESGTEKVESALGKGNGAMPEGWDRIRGDLTKRAGKEGLIDVAYEIHDSPFGPLLVGSTDAGLVRVALSVENEAAVLEDLARKVSGRILRTERPPITRARKQLDQYFEGKRKKFRLKLDWQLVHGFRREVLDATTEIPYGTTRSYAEVAVEAGSPKAVRAAGSALAANPLPIVVPCHRVLRSDGQIGSYLGGSPMKKELLEMEKAGA